MTMIKEYVELSATGHILLGLWILVIVVSAIYLLLRK